MPNVSVVIPAYKAACTICRAVDSVLAQTASAHEIIVVDDGSPDEVADVVAQSYGERVILLRKPNGGAASARNMGIERATGEFVAFLDADDYWEPEKLAVQTAVLRRYPEVALVAGGYFLQNPGESRTASEIVPLPLRDRLLTLHGAAAFDAATVAWTGTVIVRRNLLGNERFVSGLEPAEDRDLWFRLINRHPAYLISQPLATGVQEPGSLSRSNIERDCTRFLAVVNRHRGALGWVATRHWRAVVCYRRSLDDTSPAASLAWLMRSVLMWPLPVSKLATATPPQRLKRSLVLAARCVAAKKPCGNRTPHRHVPVAAGRDDESLKAR